MAKVLIIGASRGIGFETVKAALRAGHRVRALARSAASVPIQDTKLEKVSRPRHILRRRAETIALRRGNKDKANFRFNQRRRQQAWPHKSGSHQILEAPHAA